MPGWVALVITYLAVRAFWWLNAQPLGLVDAGWIDESLLKLAIWLVPCVVTLLIARRSFTSAARGLGLIGSPRPGFKFGVMATAPMAVTVLFASRISTTVDAVIGTAIIGPFAEEILFRGFLFLALRRAGWRLWFAMTVSAAAFALAHNQWIATRAILGVAALLFSTSSWVSGFGVGSALLSLVPLAAAGLLFAWLTHRWGSLWPAIAIHAFINFWWELSDRTVQLASISHTSFAPLPVAHAIAVLLAIGLTLRVTGRQVRKVQRVQPVQV